MIDNAESTTTATAAVDCPSCGARRTDPRVPCPQCGAPAITHAGDHRRGGRAATEAAMLGVRASDIEPYKGLGYLSKLFKLMAVIMVILLLAEVVTGLIAQGAAAIPTLLSEVSRLVVLAGLLWGAGDLALLLIDVGHDVRAGRIMLGRQTMHQFQGQPAAAPTQPARQLADQPVPAGEREIAHR